MAFPPSPFDVKATIAEFDPPVTDEMSGAAGVVAGTNDAEADDASLVPVALAATTVQVYVLPLSSEPTVIGELAPDADCVTPPSLDVQVTV